jgi:hypothetical protein
MVSCPLDALSHGSGDPARSIIAKAVLKVSADCSRGDCRGE